MTVVACEVKFRRALADERAFGDVGPYEQLVGRVHVAVDPNHPGNAGITDLGLAPRDADGLVHCTADLSILRPVEPQRGNRRLLLDVPNRGCPVSLRFMNRASQPTDPSHPPDLGDGFLMRLGYTVCCCGWQHDVPAVDGLLRVAVPEAVMPDGPISGPIVAMFRPNAPSHVQPLAERQHRPYLAADLEEPDAVLLVSDHENAPPQTISRDQWAFARTVEGRVAPDAAHVYLRTAFVPGKVYRAVYTTAGAPVLGLGLLTVRDVVSYLRYRSAQEDNLCAAEPDYVYGFGMSQSGRFLRQFLYLGLNQDEEGRTVFDGVMPLGAGGVRGEFNQRFGQPSSNARQSMGALFPFADAMLTDPRAGRSDSLLKQQGARGGMPKLFVIDTSSEYWRGDGSLVHTDVQGAHDLSPSAAVRVYHYAGTQHVPGTLPLTNANRSSGTRGRYPFNCVDYAPLVRAALVRLDRWVADRKEPPFSRYPLLADGSAVLPKQVAERLKTIPGVRFPAHVPYLTYLDFGPGSERGVATALPPRVGPAYPRYVPAVDEDGNEVSGVCLPDIRVPLATYLPWNLRHPDIGAPEQILGTMGATLPFAPTREAREAAGDPRASIAERYRSKQEYLERVVEVTAELVAEGYLLPEDLGLVMEQAAQRYDLFTAQR